MQGKTIRTGEKLVVSVYRGSETGELHLDDDRGVYFSTDCSYAQQYGPVVGRYLVTLVKPLVVTGEEAEGTIEIDRTTLLARGFDGRVIVYDDGEMDVVAFSLDAVVLDDIRPSGPPI